MNFTGKITEISPIKTGKTKKGDDWASLDFELTESLVKSDLQPLFNSFDIIVTQGFIGGTSENFTTTLGREGSDYTASILAY